MHGVKPLEGDPKVQTNKNTLYKTRLRYFQVHRLHISQQQHRLWEREGHMKSRAARAPVWLLVSRFFSSKIPSSCAY